VGVGFSVLSPAPGPPAETRRYISWILRVSRKLHESSNVTSLVLEPAASMPLTAGLAGQYIVLRLRPGPDESALLRSYSLSGAPSEDRYRISVKREPHGAAGAYIDTQIQPGDVLDVGTARRSLTLQRGTVLRSFSAPASAPRS
jgi:ferredoxin-NADP reductase